MEPLRATAYPGADLFIKVQGADAPSPLTLTLSLVGRAAARFQFAGRAPRGPRIGALSRNRLRPRRFFINEVGGSALKPAWAKPLKSAWAENPKACLGRTAYPLDDFS